MEESSVPWTEKYRPTHFDRMVLSLVNKTLFSAIVTTKFFPNLLVHGPGGNGKTTAIMALVREHQKRHMDPDITRKGADTSVLFDPSTVIVMNASDDRGVDVVRNQIRQFTQSGNMFSSAKTLPSDTKTLPPGTKSRITKFVVLDEVDSMTQSAQVALKTIVQSCAGTNVRFCIICNYISRLDMSLRREFMCVRFDQLPKHDICAFVRSIADAEKVDITDAEIDAARQMHRSDLRSMVNYLQTYRPNVSCAITDDIWRKIRDAIVADPGKVAVIMRTTMARHGITIRSLCAQYYSFWIQFPEVGVHLHLSRVETLMRMPEDADVDITIDYFIQTEKKRLCSIV